jgi:hypothetical protein
MAVSRDRLAVRRIHRIIATGLIATILAVMWWVFKEHIEWVGFPDGYVAELDAAENTMAGWFGWFTLAMLVTLGLLIWRSFFAGVGRWLLLVAGLYVIVVAGAVGLDMHFRTYMMDSRGG